MKKKLFILSIFVVLGIAFFFLWRESTLVTQIFRVPAQQSTSGNITDSLSRNVYDQKDTIDSWEVWLDEQTGIQTEALLEEIGKQMPYELAGAKRQIEVLKAQTRAAFLRKAEELKQHSDKPPSVRVYDFSELPPPEEQQEYGPKKHTGPQTVEALLKSFEQMTANPEIDEKYPQAEWLQMLLEKGVTIEHFGDYSGYMAARWSLARLENQPEEWVSGKLGIPPADDWELYKNAYIDRKIWERQQRKAARQTDPQVLDVLFLGPNGDTIIPVYGKNVIVHRTRGGGVFTGSSLSDEQKFDILFRGKHPEGYDIVYISEDGHALGEKPPLITREEVSTPPEGWEPLPPKDGFVQQTSPSNLDPHPKRYEDSPERNPNPTNKMTEQAEARQRQVEQVQREVIKFANMSDSEFEAEINKLLTPKLAIEDDIKKSPQQFDSTRLQRAIVTLNQYGPEEGLRRLKADDPEIAEQVEQVIRRQSPLRPTEHKNLREKSPQED